MWKLLDKLITERGSAKIMEKRADLSDREFAFDLKVFRFNDVPPTEKCLILEEQNAMLTAENKDLKATNADLEGQIADLRKTDEITPKQGETIAYLFDKGKSVEFSEMVRRLGCSEGETRYHLDVLVEAGLVSHYPGYEGYALESFWESEHVPASPETFTITQKGRERHMKG